MPCHGWGACAAIFELCVAILRRNVPIRCELHIPFVTQCLTSMRAIGITRIAQKLGGGGNFSCHVLKKCGSQRFLNGITELSFKLCAGSRELNDEFLLNRSLFKNDFAQPFLLAGVIGSPTRPHEGSSSQVRLHWWPALSDQTRAFRLPP